MDMIPARGKEYRRRFINDENNATVKGETKKRIINQEQKEKFKGKEWGGRAAV